MNGILTGCALKSRAGSESQAAEDLKTRLVVARIMPVKLLVDLGQSKLLPRGDWTYQIFALSLFDPALDLR